MVFHCLKHIFFPSPANCGGGVNSLQGPLTTQIHYHSGFNGPPNRNNTSATISGTGKELLRDSNIMSIVLKFYTELANI